MWYSCQAKHQPWGHLGCPGKACCPPPRPDQHSPEAPRTPPWTLTLKWKSMKWDPIAPGLPTHPPDGSIRVLICPSYAAWLFLETCHPFFLTYRRLYIINIRNNVLKISVHPRKHHHNLCHKHVQHEFPLRLLLGQPKGSIGVLSIRCYGKTQTNLLANPILICIYI